MKFSQISSPVILTILILSGCSSHQSGALVTSSAESRRATYEASADHFIIATQGIAATQAAKDVYARGGNLIDAAVAASFVISVERPQSTGLGGGGFMIFKDAPSKKIYAIDFRERAPLKAKEKMYLDAKGNVIENMSSQGIFAVGTPGVVAGLWQIHKKFGRLPWQDLIQPAIDLAEQGFPVYTDLADAMKSSAEQFKKTPDAQKIFLKEDGSPYNEGETLIQTDLAESLRLLAKNGVNEFYNGNIAKAITTTSLRYQGLLRSRDLTEYKVHWRTPVRAHYKDYEIVSFPPPSSGGIHVIEILNILAGDNLQKMGAWSPMAVHLTSSAMQLAFADRAQFLGDPDFVKVPSHGLQSLKYAKTQRERIPNDKALNSDQMAAGNPLPYESNDTTNFSMMDDHGSAIISTQTVNGYFGSGIVAEGTGIVLNNQMDDFSAKPGAQNIYGAVGGTPNSIKPRKTPLSSMSPTLVLKKGDVVLGLGARGGTRIITCVAQTILNRLEYGMSLYDSISALRFHHQWKPDELILESPGPDQATVDALKAMGHPVKLGSVACRVNGVAREGSKLWALPIRGIWVRVLAFNG